MAADLNESPLRHTDKRETDLINVLCYIRALFTLRGLVRVCSVPILKRSLGTMISNTKDRGSRIA